LARKILLADDSVTAQNMGRKILADAGYEVIAVNNGSAALKKIVELKPDLVILDVYMPGYSGLEVCQRLKESQETARIPVLLSVGKLEPFKPEEAQRVRADGFIVKPFEASELLSALSKMEDKVVPRAEPSKPGRFARAIAAAEESGRGGGSTAGEKNGWKNRIGFPQEKTESAEKVADDSSIYNSMNRDLRTVVETAGEKAAEQVAKQKEQAAAAADTSVDVAALTPAGLPKDVTPEEVAAIAAAAAQLQRAGEAPQAGETDLALPVAQYDASGEAGATRETAPESKIGSVAYAAAPDQTERPRDGESSAVASDDPVTMAATAESVGDSSGASRWTAVQVGLEGDEASISLEQEMQKMQKAYAAFAAAETEPVASVQEPGAATERTEEAVETQVAAGSIPGSESVPEPEPAVAAEVSQEEPQPVVESNGAATLEADAPAPIAAEVATVEAVAENSASPEFAGTNREAMPVAEFMTPVSEAEVAGLAGLVGLGAQIQEPAPQDEPAIAEETSTSRAFAPIVRATEEAAENAPENKPDSEDVKSTAAAWASWRQIRDTGNGDEGVRPEVAELAASESGPAETARAVAAGAEQIVQEASAGAASENPADVASIVDSVLADLRPKLMAEISRKMAEKK